VLYKSLDRLDVLYSIRLLYRTKIEQINKQTAPIGGVNASIGRGGVNSPIVPFRPRRVNNTNLDIIKEELILPYNTIKSYKNIRLINYLAF
jgi:hypothetical protein